MPRRTAEEANRTRRALLAAGRQMLSERGFDRLNLEEVSEVAGVTRGAVYHHFGSKEGLFRSVLEEVMAEQGRRILARAEAAEDPWNALLDGCRAFLEGALDDSYRRIVLLDGPSVLGVEEWNALDERHTTASLLEGLQENRRELIHKDLEALAQALSGAMNQLGLWAAAAGTPPGDGGDGTADRSRPAERALTALEALLAALRRR